MSKRTLLHVYTVAAIDVSFLEGEISTGYHYPSYYRSHAEKLRRLRSLMERIERRLCGEEA